MIFEDLEIANKNIQENAIKLLFYLSFSNNI